MNQSPGNPSEENPPTLRPWHEACQERLRAGLRALGTSGVMVTWDILDGHIILTAGCQRGIFHSYQQAMAGLIVWAGEILREDVEKEVKRQLERTEKRLGQTHPASTGAPQGRWGDPVLP